MLAAYVRFRLFPLACYVDGSVRLAVSIFTCACTWGAGSSTSATSASRPVLPTVLTIAMKSVQLCPSFVNTSTSTSSSASALSPLHRANKCSALACLTDAGALASPTSTSSSVSALRCPLLDARQCSALLYLLLYSLIDPSRILRFELQPRVLSSPPR